MALITMCLKKLIAPIFCLYILLIGNDLFGYEIFVYRPLKNKRPLFQEKKIFLHGEFFGQLQLPGTFPSYNDLSGPEDRWTYGFRTSIFLTENFSFLAQLVTHDDGSKRTKFDWNFTLRYSPAEHLVLIFGHDSNHDSDYQSIIDGYVFFLNRNYLGLGLPFKRGNFYFEPFTWILYHTNHTSHLDLSGDELLQEYGIRMGAWFDETFGFSLQIIGQSESLFSLSQAILADLIFRVRLLNYLELSIGASVWKDIQESPLGNKKTFHKIHWGLAIPF